MLDLIILQCAPGTGGSGGQGAGGGIEFLIMMVAIFVIFYFLLIRPQQKKQKELKKTIEALDKNDRFITAGGLYGTVVSIKDNVVTAKIAENVKVEIAKSAVSYVFPKE